MIEGNIVLVIAKADTMTVSESNQFRKEVGELLEKHDIPLYDWKLPCFSCSGKDVPTLACSSCEKDEKITRR